MTAFVCFIYVTLLFKTKINIAPVLKYHGDVMMCRLRAHVYGVP